jgi:hypothetical protein
MEQKQMQGNRIRLKKHLTAENTEDTEGQTGSPAFDSRLRWGGFFWLLLFSAFFLGVLAVLF